jgi:hypothetical protein
MNHQRPNDRIVAQFRLERAVSTGSLRGIQTFVGSRNQLSGVGQQIQLMDHGCSHRDRWQRRFADRRCLKLQYDFSHATHNDVNLARSTSAADDSQFVAAISSHKVVGPQRPPQRFCDGTQCGITGLMSELIVDLLEVIQIDQDNRNGLAAS